MRRSLLAVLTAALMIFSLRPESAPARTDPKLDAAPAGIAPTSATVAEVLRQHAKAIGALEPGTPNTRRETWRLSDAGFAGTETLVRRGLDYHARLSHGPFVEEYGQVDGKRWHLGLNGTVSSRVAEDYVSFAMFRVLEDAADPKNDLKMLGEVREAKPAYVIEVRLPLEKHPEWIFFDEATGLVDRTEGVVDDERIVSTYDDYRVTKGLSEPWHVHDTEGASGVEYDYLRQSLAIGDPVEAAEFKVPEGRFNPATVVGPAAIPSKITNAVVVVRLNVGDRGLDFELSAGQPESLIDRDVAAELKLPTFGQMTHARDGDLGYDTQIADAKIGSISLHDFALRAESFHYHADGGTKIVGVLGSDFLSSGLFLIDYVNRNVQLEAASSADGIAAAANSWDMPVRFDDGIPFVKGTIAQHDSDSILFSNAFPFSMIFGAFTSRYPQAIPDTKGKAHAVASVPFADSKSYGQAVELWITRVPDFFFGTLHLKNQPMFATNVDLPATRRIDAVVGADTLQYFDIYLDFAHQRLILLPNKFFFKAYKLS